MERIAEKRKAAAAKRAAEIKEARKLSWLNTALLPDFEKKLLDVFNKQACFCGGEDDGVLFALSDYNVVFFVDEDFCPVGRIDGKACGHALRVTAEVREGKLISYQIAGHGKYERFVKLVTQHGVVKKD
jgi:hypothetical protein